MHLRWLAFAGALLVASCTQRDEPSQLAPFTFTDQIGRPFSRADLAGHVWIADFIYTSCQGACPLITSRLVALQQRVHAPSLHFVSFSVDPENDTPGALSRYAARWNPEETRWSLLSTNAEQLASLTEHLKLELTRDRGELVHTNRFFLIDVNGDVVGNYDSSDDAAVTRLVGDSARLLRIEPETAVSGTGRELFESLACAGCHADAQLAPPLGGLAGARVMFEREAALRADDAYLRESIASPEAKIVAGYPDSMPHYGSLLSDAQIDGLVSYVKSLPSSADAPADVASLEHDPVCGMSTRITAQTPHQEYEGRRYHFCSASCARRFAANPEKYANVAAGGSN